MTRIYFVRHCKPDGKIKDDRNRPLTEEGLEDSIKVAEILKDKQIDVFISSPYRRSYDSIKKAAESYGMEIQTDERLHERKAGKDGNNHEMFKKRWADFAYAEKDGTHGTALSSIINYYDKTFNGESFMKIIDFMPWILKMEFDGKKFLSMEDVFHIYKEYKEE